MPDDSVKRARRAAEEAAEAAELEAKAARKQKPTEIAGDDEAERKRLKKEKKRKAAEEAADEAELEAILARKQKRKEERLAAEAADLEEAAPKRQKKEKKQAVEEPAEAADLEAAEKAKQKKKQKEELLKAAELEENLRAADLLEANRKKKRKEERQAVWEAAAAASKPTVAAEVDETADWDWEAPSKTRRGKKKSTADVDAAAESNSFQNEEVVQAQEATPVQMISPKVYAAENRDACRVLFGSLQPEVTEDMLREQFEYCGEIQNVHVVKDWEGYCKGVGFVTFADTDGVSVALAANGSYFRARKINVSMATPKEGKGGGKDKGKDKGKDTGKEKGRGKGPGHKPAGCTGIVVKQLAFTATEDDLRETFKSCGAGPTTVKLLFHSDTGKSKGLAFVDFAQEGEDVGKSVVEAVRLSGNILKGRPFYVEYN